jgi:hypothetical protein
MKTDIILDRGPNQRDSRIIASSTRDVEPVLEANKAAEPVDPSAPGQRQWQTLTNHPAFTG